MSAEVPGTTWGDVVPSPDGRWLVAPRHHNGRWQLVRWRAGSMASLAAITPPAEVVADPVWGLGGVLFVTDAAGFPQVHLWKDGEGITRLTAEPRTMSAADVDALRAVGLDDLDILDLNNLVAYYSYINRVANGLGLISEIPEAHALRALPQ